MLAERTQLLAAFDDRQKVVARELADFAGETHIAVGQQNLSLADAAGIEDNLARRRIASVVLVFQTEIELAEGNPAPFPTPPHVNDPLPVRQHGPKLRAGLRRAFGFEACNES